MKKIYLIIIIFLLFNSVKAIDVNYEQLSTNNVCDNGGNEFKIENIKAIKCNYTMKEGANEYFELLQIIINNNESGSQFFYVNNNEEPEDTYFETDDYKIKFRVPDNFINTVVQQGACPNLYLGQMPHDSQCTFPDKTIYLDHDSTAFTKTCDVRGYKITRDGLIKDTELIANKEFYVWYNCDDDSHHSSTEIFDSSSKVCEYTFAFDDDRPNYNANAEIKFITRVLNDGSKSYSIVGHLNVKNGTGNLVTYDINEEVNDISSIPSITFTPGGSSNYNREYYYIVFGEDASEFFSRDDCVDGENEACSAVSYDGSIRKYFISSNYEECNSASLPEYGINNGNNGVGGNMGIVNFEREFPSMGEMLGSGTSSCRETLGENLTQLIRTAVRIFQGAAVVAALINGMIMFIPAIFAKDVEAMKTSSKKFVKMLGVLAAILILPVIVKIIAYICGLDITCLM